MATGHLIDTFRSSLDAGPPGLVGSGPGSEGLVHLGVMDTTPSTPDLLEPVFTIAELAERLSVTRQALYDLRCKGRGPRGFRVGRQLRFRRSEVEAWLARLESEDQTRHGPGGSR